MPDPEVIVVEVETDPVTVVVEVEGPPGGTGSAGADGVDGADGRSVTSATVNGSGDLILTLSDSSTVNAGHVVGATGATGSTGATGATGPQGVSITGASVDGSGNLILTLSSGGTVNAGHVVGATGATGATGAPGADGDDGLYVTGAAVNGSNHLIITLSDTSTIDAGSVVPAGSGDMQKSTYDTNNNGKVDEAEAVAWSGITSKPTSLSGYGITDAQPLDSDLTAIAALVSAANKLPYATGSGTWGLADFSSFGRSLVDDADASAARTTLALGTVATLNTGTSAGNVPVLDGSGLLDTAVIPAIAITDVFTPADQTAMLALTAQKGDVAIRTDVSKTFILSTNSPSTLADWKELPVPTDLVLSVAGLTGAISASSLRTALGLVIGTNVQAWDADLDAIAALTPSNDDFVQRKSGAWANRTLPQVRADLNTYATVSSNADFTLTVGSDAEYIRHTGTLTADRAVTLSTSGAAAGAKFKITRTGSGNFNLNVGTGPLKALHTNTWAEFEYDGAAWFLVAHGVTNTSSFIETLLDDANQAAAQATLGITGGTLVLLGSATASAASSIVFTSGVTSDYDEFVFEILSLYPGTAGSDFVMEVSSDGGSSWVSTGDGTRITGTTSGTTAFSGGVGGVIVGSVAGSAASGLMGKISLLRTSARAAAIGDFFYVRNTNTKWEMCTARTNWALSAALNAVRFTFNGSSTATGTIRMYGVKNS